MIHLAIVHSPYLERILDGAKTIEGRFLSRRVAPYDQIRQGDLVALKAAGGPLRATARVSAVAQHADLTPALLRQLLECYATELQIEPDFAAQVQGRRYAVLIWLANLVLLDPPLPLPRRDRRPWVVLTNGEQATWVRAVRGAVSIRGDSESMPLSETARLNSAVIPGVEPTGSLSGDNRLV